MIHVLLADDHQLFRKGVHKLLSRHQDINIVAEAKDGKELLDQLNTHHPDVAIIDLSMPELSGMQALDVIKNEFPNQNFIVLSMHAEKEYIIKSIQSGARAYLLKNAEEEELLKAVRTAANGNDYYSDFVNEVMAAFPDKTHTLPTLTERELQIINLVANGMSTKMIADQLDISSRTVETHRVNIMKKLDAHNTAQLIKRGIKLGYIRTC